MMAEPSNPHSTPGENPEPSSQVAVEDEAEGDAPVENFPVLKFSKLSFYNLMMDIQMPLEYGAIHPQEGDTTADAPTGYVTIGADFLAFVLEWYNLHISQLGPFGMIRVRNFEYAFRALGMEPTVRDFRRFYQMTVSMGFFSFRQRDGSPKLMVPPKGMTKWKTKFFYIKAAAVAAKLTFRNVTGPIITEGISVPNTDTMDWFPTLQIIG
ncbi:hypothetical protein Hanom_Chr05g00456991 [Helianthus anomalus]